MAWFFKDEATAYSNNVRDQLIDSTAYVPALWTLELANALLMAENKKRISSADVTQVLAEIKLLPIQVEKEEPDSAALIALARQYKLSVYDATYLNLAMQKGLPLASKDEQLISAAKKCGIPAVSKTH
jgi:predicted nucleic acid-binding protein